LYLNGQHKQKKNRKQQIQRFSIPYTLSTDRLEAKYARLKEGGTLSLLFKKPDLSSSGSVSGQFTKFTVNAVSGSEGKVTMTAGETKEIYQFKTSGEPKLETEVVGELVDGDQVKFNFITIDNKAGTRKTATQTFTLPMKITTDQIEVEEGGHRIVIRRKASFASSAVTLLPDIDVLIIPV